MVQTRTGTGEHSEAQADSIAAQLAAIAAKLDTMDVLKADIAALKNKAKEKSGGGYGGQETGESSWSSHRFQRPHNKIEFPKFSDGDPRGWLLKAEKYFRYYQIPEEDKIEVAAMHLEGDALDLYSWMSIDQPLLLWEDLVHAFNKNFGPAEFQNPDEFLCSIKQTGTVQEYRQEFAKRSARVANWPDHCLLGVFLNGLKSELKSDVRIHKPRTVYNAMSLAIEFEAKTTQSKGDKGAAGEGNNVVDQLQGRTNSVVQWNTPAATQQRPPLRLSDAEKQIRFNRGECFRCGEKYGPGHRCKTNSLHLLVAEGQNDDEIMEAEEQVERVAEISLHAILGLPHNTTLIVPGLINSSHVSVLVDCGSTHNFINDSLVPKLGLTTKEVVPFGVRLGNGELIRCHQVCKEVRLCLGDLKLTKDLYPFSLGGADVVLGIQWLATLNTVMANWKDMFLKFTINGKEHTLQGKPPNEKPSATFRHFTVETIGRDITESFIRIANRLEDKSNFGVGCIDTIPPNVGGKALVSVGGKAPKVGKLRGEVVV